MAYKTRTESTELLCLKSLNTRMDLSDKDKKHYYNLKKGYEGEVMFDLMTEKLQCECYILNDLRLKINNTMFQIDTTIIVSETIHFHEVKNYDGDYYFEDDKFYKKPKSDINNPLHQLSRSDTMLRQLLHSLGYNIAIDGSVVFINPEFSLFQAPLNKPIILPTQLNRYMKKLNVTPSKLNAKHKMLAKKLVSLHIEHYPFMELPPYRYEQLRKRIICAKCSSFSVFVVGKCCVCGDCGHKEPVEGAVMRCVKEFMLLFPNEKVTTKIIHDWCGGMVSKKWIRSILEKNFNIVGFGRWAYFEKKTN